MLGRASHLGPGILQTHLSPLRGRRWGTRFCGIADGDIKSADENGALAMLRTGILILTIGLAECPAVVAAQTPQQAPLPPGWAPATESHPARPPVPVRDPHMAGYVAAK